MGPGPARAGTDLAALLADPAVCVATPHAQHAEAIEACLCAGKPVLCEKPLVATAAQARRVVALARWLDDARRVVGVRYPFA